VKIIHQEIMIKPRVEKVWRHLTDPKKIADWFLPTDFEARVGKRFTLRCAEQGTIYCEVREVVPCEKLVYSFKAAIAKAETLVTFALFQFGEHTRLILTHSGWERLQPEEEAVFKMFEQGWEGRFLKRLKQLLEMNDTG
jgi:uncharacterized protein YndB with AHSA1/START domain